jgi:hypothetical protein
MSDMPVRSLTWLYEYLRFLSIKPEYGGSRNSTPEKRRAVKDRIAAIEETGITNDDRRERLQDLTGDHYSIEETE